MLPASCGLSGRYSKVLGLTFSNSTFCPHTVFMSFVWISEQTAIISLYNINCLVFITDTECVHCAVRTAPFPQSVSSHNAPYSCLSTCRCHEKDKGAKLGEIPKCNARPEVRENWIGKYIDSFILREGAQAVTVFVLLTVNGWSKSVCSDAVPDGLLS
jgi:hypothetical protein